MSLLQERQDQLFQLIQKGVDRSAQRLNKMSGASWSLDTLCWNSAFEEDAKDFFGSKEEESHYGLYFSMPGGAFLAIFSPQSSSALVDAYVGPLSPSWQSTQDLEPAALGEISGILVNAVCDVLADACDISFILSAPKILAGSKSELLRKTLYQFNGYKGPGRGLMILSQVRMSAPTLPSECTLITLLSRTLLEALQTQYT